MSETSNLFDQIKHFFIKTKNAVCFIVDSLQKVHDRKSPVYFILAILLVAAGLKVFMFDLTSERVYHRSDSFSRRPKISKPMTKPVVKPEEKPANNL